jgi:hypothetical protein
MTQTITPGKWKRLVEIRKQKWGKEEVLGAVKEVIGAAKEV